MILQKILIKKRVDIMESHIGFSEEQKEKMRKEAVLDYIETSEDLRQAKKENYKNNKCNHNNHLNN